MQIYSYNNKEMFLPNPRTYSNISSLNSHFKYYSTYYNDSSSLQTSNLSTIPYSTNQPLPKHKPKIKTTFQRTHPKPFKHAHIIQSNPNKPHIHLSKPSRNKTNFLLANYKTALSTNANWITSNPSLTHTTIPESDGKYITKTDMTINNLLQKSKYNSQYNYYKDSPSQTDTINVDEYCSFMHLLENKPKVRQLSKGIMTLLSTHNNTNNTFHNEHNEPETQRLHQLIIHNYYFEDVLNSLLRRIEYFTTNNQFISEDLVMNMLYEEAEKLKKKTDLQMEKYCHIKNFSSTIVIDNKRLQLLPLINSLNAKFYKGPHKHKEIYTTQLDKENDNEHGDINARLERLNEKKRTVTIKKRVKKMIMNEDGEMVEGDSYETVIEEIEIDDNGNNGTNENWFNNIGKVSYWQEFNKHQNELIAQGIIETNNRIKARMKGLVGNDVNNTKDENGYVIGSNNMFNGGKGYIDYKDGNGGRKWIIDNNNNGSSGINNSKGNMVNQYVQSNELFSIGKGDLRFGGGFGKGGGGKGIGIGLGMGSGDNGGMKGELSMLFKKYDNYKPSNNGNNNKSIVNNNNKGEEKGKSELGDNKNKGDGDNDNNNEIIDSNDSDDEDEDKEEIVNKISPVNKNNKRVKSLDKVKNKINSKKKRKNKSRSNKKKKNKQGGQDKETINQYNINEGINDNSNYTQTNMNNKTNQQEQQSNSTQYNNSYNKTNPNQQTKHIIDSLNANTLNTEENLANNNNNILTAETLNTDNNLTNQATRYNISGTKFTSGQTTKNSDHNEISNNQAITSQPEPSASPTKSKQKGHKTKPRKKNKKSKKKPPIDQPPSTFKVPYEPLPPAPSDLPNQSHIKPRPKYRSETVPTFTHPLHEELLDISEQNDPNKSNIILPGEPGVDDKYDDISSSLFYIDNSRRSTLKGPKLTTDKPKSKKLLTLMPRKDGSIGNYFLRLKEEEKIQRRNDYLYKERQRRLAEEKRKRLLGRLSNSQDTAFRHLVSFEAKLKDLNLVEKIKHQLFTETTEEGKQRFLDMLNQINKLKDIDVNQYVQDLEKELDPIQEEIDAIIKAKLIEERLNKFVNTFSDFRKKQINKRCVLSDNFKVIDNKFKTTMSDKMHYALNKKSTLKNIITHYK